MVDGHVSAHEGSRLMGSDPDEWLSGVVVAEFLRGAAEGSGGRPAHTERTKALEEGRRSHAGDEAAEWPSPISGGDAMAG
jgi:hypothetical protein